MDKFASLRSDQVNPRSAANSLQNDFAELVRIFDSELAKVRADAKTQSRIAEAKQAAERGLQLSKLLSRLIAKRD